MHISCFLNHLFFLQDFNIKIAVGFEQLQLSEQTNTQTDIATTRLKWPRGRFSENYCALSKFFKGTGQFAGVHGKISPETALFLCLLLVLRLSH